MVMAAAGLCVNAMAQDTSAIHLEKTVSEADENGIYHLTLEAFLTGTENSETTHVRVPNDIVLVLDASTSMSQNIATETTYTKLGSKAYSYDGYGNNTYYYYDGEKYYPVQREVANQTAVYTLSYTRDRKVYYLKDSEGDITSENATIWTGELYYRWNHNNYIKRESQAYSYSNYNSTLYYKYGNDYYAVSKNKVLTGGTYDLFYVDESDKVHYLTGTGVSDTQPENVTTSDGTIWTGELYQASSGSESKLSILKNAVSDFIDIVAEDAEEYDVDHKISIIKYSGRYANDNHLTISTTSGRTALLANLTSATSTTTLKNAVNGIQASGGTHSDYGMQIASEVLSSSNKQYVPGTEEAPRNAVVIMFTDGVPTDGTSYNFNTTVANDAISNSKTVKSKAIVYSVGVFDPDDVNNNVKNYMNGVSSNYPNATSITNLGTGSADNGYSFIVNDAESLSAIFTAIAQESGKSTPGYELDESTVSIKDIITPYFKLPTSMSNPSDIKVYTQNLIAVNTATDGSTTYVFDGKNVPLEGAKVVISGNDNRNISITGFNFTENFCRNKMTTVDGGKPTYEPKGKKMVIDIPIQIDPANPGGATLYTNLPTSGLYQGDVEIKPFPLPVFTLPNIILVKSGLKVGESATFTISKIKDGTTDTEDTSFTPFQVIVTCTAADKTPTAKIKLQHAGRYKVQETNWSWAYEPYPVDPKTLSWADDGKSGYGSDYIIRNINKATEAEFEAMKESGNEMSANRGTVYVFRNEPKESIKLSDGTHPLPLHDEDTVNNVFAQPTGTSN